MAFKEISTLDAESTVALGGRNRKTGKNNPTSAEGYYLGTRQVASPKSKTGFAAIHFVQTPKGNLGIWGKTDMDKKFAQVTPGTMIRVSFDKMVPTPNGEMYKYKLEVDKTNTIDVADIQAASAPDEDTTSDDTESYSDADEEVDEEQDEDAVQAAALTALERKKKVEALLKPKR